MASVTSGGQRYGYTYDSMGNIATFSAPGKGTVTYTYDNQGQLLKAAGDTNYTYTYDGAGNILTASDGTATHSYTYGDTNWKDLLTAFDGQAITYDAIGNPTSYYNGTRWAMTWENGRSLATASDGTNSLSFAYDASGLRTSKTVNGTTYRYYYTGGKLMRMSWGANIVDFFYDASGLPYAMKYNGTAYYYITNLQGDVMRIVDASGTVMASYDYDPYGKVISATGTLAGVNPLRYRGYVYDQETGFYYLQSRYYDPTIGRFLNADGYASTGQGIIGHNTYTYCLNNPINNFDSLGEFTLSVVLGAAIGGAIAGAFIGTVSHLISSGINGTSVTASSLINAAATGAITGAIGAVGGAIGGTAAVFASVAVGIFSGTVTAINTDGPILRKIVSGLTATMVAGFGTYYGTQFPVALNNPFTSGVTSFSGGLFTGMQTEIVNVATQQLVPKLFQNSNSDFNRDLIRVRETIRNQSPFTNRALLY